MLVANRYKIIGVVTAIFLMLTISVAAQPGLVDAAFNLKDVVKPKGFNAPVMCSVTQPDGKVLLGGFFFIADGTKKLGIARLNIDGSLDNGFNVDFRLPEYSSTAWAVYSMALQADGKIVIGGQFSNIGGLSRNNIARLLPNGDVDSSFNPGSGFNSTLLTVKCQNDGKVVAGGFFTTFNSIAASGLVRLKHDGSFDDTFSTTGWGSGSVRAIEISTDGKIYVGGFQLKRLLANGEVDASFTSGFTKSVQALQLQQDGKLLVGSNTISAGTNSLARLMPGGSIDGSFNPPVIDGTTNHFQILPANKILVLGSFAEKAMILNDDGSKDAAFAIAANSTYNQKFSTSSLFGGKLLLAGDVTFYASYDTKRIALFDFNGVLDSVFLNPALGINHASSNIVVQTDQKVLIAGQFNFYNGNRRNFLARLHSNGELDSSFAPGTGADYFVNG